MKEFNKVQKTVYNEKYIKSQNQGLRMIETLNKLSKPLQALFSNITDRFNNPLGGAFLFSWIIINWKAVYYFLFSDQKVADKIIYLEKIYITDKIIDLWPLIYIPLILAIIYLLISPLISNIATGIWSYSNTSLEAKRKEWVHGIAILSEDDKRNMWLSIKNERAIHATEITNLKNEISGLKNLDNLKEEQNEKAEPNPNVFEISFGNEESNDDKSPKITNKELLNKLSMDTLSHKVKIWISEEFNLNYDISIHKQETEYIFTIFKVLLADSSYEPSLINVNNKSQSIESVKAKLYSLKKLGFVIQNNVDDTYSLSPNTINILKNTIK